MSIVSTVSGGRTHIACGTTYIGSVNSYQHWLTKLVARILKLAISVTVNGKERLINKKSYRKLLISIGNEQSVNLQDHSTIDQSLSSAIQLPNIGNIRDHISNHKRTKLFKKLAQAILDGNQERAVKMIHKGADLEELYHQIGNRALSFGNFEQELNSDLAYKFQVMAGTPLIHAQENALDKVIQALVEAGANKGIKGERYQWKRRITAINRQTKWDLFPTLGLFPGLFCGLGLGRKETAEPIYDIKYKNREAVPFVEHS